MNANTFRTVESVVATLRTRSDAVRPPETGIREMYGISVDMSDRIQSMACKVAGRATRLGIITARTKTGQPVVILSENRGSGKTPGPKTFTGTNHTGTEHRMFPDFGDMFQEAVIKGMLVVKENPNITEPKLGGAMKWALYSLIRSNFRKDNVSRTYGKRKAEQDTYTAADVAESKLGELAKHCPTEIWDTLTDNEQTILAMYGRGSTLQTIAEHLDYADHAGIRYALGAIGRKLQFAAPTKAQTQLVQV